MNRLVKRELSAEGINFLEVRGFNRFKLKSPVTIMSLNTCINSKG